MMEKKSIILGAGLSGIGAASILHDYSIYEASSMPFGHAKSNKFNGYFYDEGAHICHSKDAEWLKKIDAENKCVFQKSIVKNFYSGRFINYPIQDNLRDLIPEEREKALNSAIKELSRKKLIANNYYEWCKNQYGAYITEKFYRTFTDKYWRTNMEDLSIDWLGGRLLKTNLKRLQDGAMSKVKSNAAFNKFYYPKEKGFGNLFKNLIDISRVKLNKEATKINLKKKYVIFNKNEKIYYKDLITTIPLNKLVSITEDVPDKVLAASRKLKFLNLIQINLKINKNIDIPKNTHWFYVYDRNLEPARVSILNNLNKSRNSDNFYIIQAEIFRRNDENYNFEDIASKGLKDLLNIFNSDESSIIDVNFQFIEHSYVVSDHHRKQSVKTILNWYEKNSVTSSGLYGKWFYIWSDAAYSMGVADALKVSQ